MVYALRKDRRMEMAMKEVESTNRQLESGKDVAFSLFCRIKNYAQEKISPTGYVNKISQFSLLKEILS